MVVARNCAVWVTSSQINRSSLQQTVPTLKTWALLRPSALGRCPEHVALLEVGVGAAEDVVLGINCSAPSGEKPFVRQSSHAQKLS